VKISVIISCFNAEKNIYQCLNSLVHQTYSNIEIIVVDASSNDKTVNIIEDNFEQVKLIKVKHIGVGAALNIGIRNSSGEILVIDFNTDEYADKNWAMNLIQSHKIYPSNHIIGSTRLLENNFVDEYGVNFSKRGSSIKIGNNSLYNEARNSEYCDFVGLSSFKRQLIDDIGYIDEKYYFYGADADFNIRARINGYKVLTNPKSYTFHKVSFNKIQDSKRYYKNMNYGLLRLTSIHGSKIVFLNSIFYYIIFLPTLKILKSIYYLLQFKSTTFNLEFNEFMGRQKGNLLFLKSLKDTLKIRKLVSRKLIT